MIDDNSTDTSFDPQLKLKHLSKKNEDIVEELSKVKENNVFISFNRHI